MAERGDEFFGKAESLSLDGEVRTTGHKVEGGTEGAEGGLVDRLDGHDGGDADGEGEQIEERKGFVPEKVTPPVGQENVERMEPVQGQLVEWIRPSTRAMRRSAEAATSGLWVTRTTVVFCWRASRVMSSMTAVLEAESRLPVGSSARRTEG